MAWDQTLKDLINASDVTQVFGLTTEQLIFVFASSVVVGHISLTYYYVFGSKSKAWAELHLLEKSVISLVVGFLTILVSLFLQLLIVIIASAGKLNGDPLAGFPLAQFKYILPFGWFYLMYKISKGKKVKARTRGLDFIKWYSVTSLIVLFIVDLFAIIALAFFAGATIPMIGIMFILACLIYVLWAPKKKVAT